jgi:hypothetical protein
MYVFLVFKNDPMYKNRVFIDLSLEFSRFVKNLCIFESIILEQFSNFILTDSWLMSG